MSADADFAGGRSQPRIRFCKGRILVWSLILALSAVTCWQGYARIGYSRSLPRLLAAIGQDGGTNPNSLLLGEVAPLLTGSPSRSLRENHWGRVAEYQWRGPFKSYNVLLTVQKRVPHAVIAIETNRQQANHLEIIEARYLGKDPLTYSSAAQPSGWTPPVVTASQRLAAEALTRIGGRIDVSPEGHVLTADMHRTPISEAELSKLDCLVSLGNLSLSNSHFNNRALRHLAQCPQLARLDLWKTDVTDPGIAYLTPLTGLESLILVETNLTDKGLQPLSQLSNLHTLQLGKTQIAGEGLRHLSGLHHLRELTLDETNVTSEALQSLAELKELKILDLTGTNVSGSGLVHLQGLEQLQTLRLVRTDLTDPGLKHLTCLPNLQGLNLRQTKVSLLGLEHQATFPSLQWICLNGSNLTDTMLASMDGLRDVTDVYLSRTQITDVGLQELSKLKSLHVLDISHTNVSGPGLCHLAGLANLTDLCLGGMQITDVSLPHVVQLKQVKNLSFAEGAPITDDGLAELAKMTHLEGLHLSQFALEGAKFRDFISDRGLRHLRSMTNLKNLTLMGTHVTPRGVSRLERALPKCMIQF